MRKCKKLIDSLIGWENQFLKIGRLLWKFFVDLNKDNSPVYLVLYYGRSLIAISWNQEFLATGARSRTNFFCARSCLLWARKVVKICRSLSSCRPQYRTCRSSNKSVINFIDGAFVIRKLCLVMTFAEIFCTNFLCCGVHLYYILFYYTATYTSNLISFSSSREGAKDMYLLPV